MDKKTQFIQFIEEKISSFEEAPKEVQEFWEAFKTGKSVGGMTEIGQKIIAYMQENQEQESNSFKAKTIAEGLFMSSRSVSSSMRKLITDGYVTKIAGNPVIYSLSDLGKAATV